jgi:PilZ domain-containing protein
MTDERRQAARGKVFLECTWTRDSRISDLSPTGCYVDTRLMPELGEELEFFVTTDQNRIAVRGTVVTVHPGIGFGFKFGDLSDETRERIRALLGDTKRD